MSDQIPDKKDNPAPLNPLGTEEGIALLAQQRRNTAILWGITGLLVVVAAGVFFVLPEFVSPPVLEQQAPVTQTTGTPVSSSTAQALSPFEEAQRLRQRESAQEILSSVLDLQEALEEKDVMTWAPTEYSDALELAAEGDTSYRQQQFTEAGEKYGEALSALQALENGIPDLLDTLVTQGNLALESGDSVAAMENFERAMAVDPSSDDAVNGIERARVLDEVLTLISQAEDATEAQDYEAARDFYRAALNLDSASSLAGEGISQMNEAIQERDFRQLMSQGYAALQGNDPDQAEARFQQALALRPGSPEATTALEQVRDQAALDAISTHMDEARSARDDEQWQEALDAWNAALAIDPALVEARNGRDEAQSRLNLDNYLKALIADPLNLADPAVYERSVDVYTSALRIPDGGPRLVEQMRQAREYLEKVRVPMNVTLQSDGQTVVNLARVQELGQFTQTTLNLTPGRYVATGFRTGYKDVRVEFEVGFDGPPAPVVISASESIR